MLQREQLLQGRYLLQEQLGANLGRQTWLARDITVSPAAPAIVKLLAFNPQMEWDEFRLFEREGQVLQQLNHRQIPKYLDYFSLDRESGGGLYWFGLVQEYIPGTSVKQLLHQGKRFSQAEVKQLAESVLEILIYLHGFNPSVLHRDIKPSNLIWGEDEKIYLIDFGAVQNRGASEGVTFTVVGTTGYAPLEQFWGKAVPASDIYALGATLIHLLTGTPPIDLPQKDLRIQFSDRISIPASFVRWIEVMTAPDLAQRFRSAKEALTALKTNRYPKINFPTIPQPRGSRVKLSKSPDYLLIKIPQPRRSLLDFIKLIGNLVVTISSLPILLFSVLIMLGGMIGLLLLSMLPPSPTPVLILLLFVILIGYSLKYTNHELKLVQEATANSLRHIFAHDYIYLDRENFILKKKLFWWTYYQIIEEIYTINKIEYLPWKTIIIETRSRTYSFAENLTENERRWLTQQLQEWLDSILNE
ncbi:MAG TPA: serine/threonine protein kinase [Cyanobacteria bacterium UBA11149]|nr:serine/threonine protein kinase [Cyanobacteria bacterium UBA11367]HBE60410.1 serine/threonine protein kinase [Cyanobacteria bacterium UBA11366]HBK64754.1 serine/threonine protein kinase [Cyanobacteria bacterium UBA11166]HBS69543.1 serine/threonine protein kinase [Cyanobacteria bacterium UBA11153]HBW92286.1 serine/threonine protein kinase [Cyanobacteria bacterium UBA11149]HCA93811.1 serine/threonine protein kinase [Cyanobacteria bacterium UBA9226]